MKVAAIVLHFRFWPEVQHTLSALLAQTRPPDQIFIVDNCSGDDSGKRLQAAYPSARLVEAPFNGGYGAGMNLGIRGAEAWGADSMLLVTHECLLAPNAIAVMVGRLEQNPTTGAVGPILGYLTDRRRVFSAGGSIDRRTWDVTHLRAGADVNQFMDGPPYQVDWLDGSCILLRTEAARQAGSINEHYFHQYDDVEYQLALQRHGWIVECAPAAVAWQEPGTAFERLRIRSRLRFVFGNAPARLAAREMIRQIYYLTREVLGRGRGGRSQASSRALGIVDFLLRRRGIPPGFERGYSRALSLLKNRAPK